MPQVSRRYLSRKVEKRILDLFLNAISICNSKNTANSLIRDLLTPTEKIMLAKRFSIAYMLLEGYDYGSISQILKVSRATVGKVSFWLKEKGDGFREVIKRIKRHETLGKVLKEAKDGFDELLASAPGKDWSRTKSELWKKRRKREKPF